MRLARLARSLCLATAVAAGASAFAKKPARSTEVMIPADAALALIESKYEADPENATNPHRLREYLKNRGQISVGEFNALTEPKPTPRPGPPRELEKQTGRVPKGTLAAATVEKRFLAEVKVREDSGEKGPGVAELMKRVRAQARPGATWFTMKQVENAEKYEFLTPTTAKQRQELDEARALFKAKSETYHEVLKTEALEKSPVRSPRIRRSWRDVLFDEDQSQPEREGKTLGDLEGALLSYVRDGRADADTWGAHGAILWPFIWEAAPASNSAVRRFSMIPSVTYDRVTTNGAASVETDTLFYRLGFQMELRGYRFAGDPATFAEHPIEDDDPDRPLALTYGMQLRGSGVYTTDTNQRAELHGFDVDLEPRLRWGKLALGYRMNLWPKHPLRDDKKDDTFLDLQVRAWLHLEGGDIQKAAAAWGAAGTSFFRLGPTVEVKLNAPEFPHGHALSLTFLYSYLAAVSGRSDHESYLHATLAYDLFRNDEVNHKVSANLNFERGGLNFTQEEVDQLTLGLGVLF